MRYAELHCHSYFSFLDGVSSPEELVEEAGQLGLTALALTDHNGLYGAVRFNEAARSHGLPPVFGAELAVAWTGHHVQDGQATQSTQSTQPVQTDRTTLPVAVQSGRTVTPAAAQLRRTTPPAASPLRHKSGKTDLTVRHLVVLAKDMEGYSKLSRIISRAHLAESSKGNFLLHDYDIASMDTSHWMVLTGCSKGPLSSALLDTGPSAAAWELDKLIDMCGQNSVAVEIWNHGNPLDTARNDALAEIAARRNVQLVATNIVHYAHASSYRLNCVFSAIREGHPLEEAQRRISPNAAASLRSAAEQHRRFARWPSTVEQAADIADECTFELHPLPPQIPSFAVPRGYSQQSWLVHLVESGATSRYGAREAPSTKRAWAQIDHELEIIHSLGYAGYFLVVWDIVRFARESGIYCQGRGSAANSAVCYSLGITQADPVSLGLLFERFLSPAREDPPDIDVDIEPQRRDEVIEYVYSRYGREHVAQVASVITYRRRSAVRDLSKALGNSLPANSQGYSLPDLDSSALPASGAFPSPNQDGHSSSPRDALPSTASPDNALLPGRHPASSSDLPASSNADRHASLISEMLGVPRHLGLHPGGVVVCDRPLSEICPVEHARRPGRTMLQWDKDSCAAMGLIKIDLLGLGILQAIHLAVDLIRNAYGVSLDIGALPQDKKVYEMLCKADTVGVFQVESRAQMATLPRMQPQSFYDLVVEIALIRPGPIQGGAVHPYLRRRQGKESAQAPHPLAERSLARTLGVPLFQEQLMTMVMDVAGFTATEADALRQAMSSKRSSERMEKLRERIFAGMAVNGIPQERAEEIYGKLAAFANFGFPESHAVSFAYMVYVSAWIKVHYPAAFYAALLGAQPMGFWSPQSIVLDAQRHGVEVLGPHVCYSSELASLEAGRQRGESCQVSPAVRLGLAGIRSLGTETARRIASMRPYASMEDLVGKAGLSTTHMELLACTGALDGLAVSDWESRQGKDSSSASGERTGRRAAVWSAGLVARASAENTAVGPLDIQARIPTVDMDCYAPGLPPMTPLEAANAEVYASGLTTGPTAISLARCMLDSMGVVPVSVLAKAGSTNSKVRVAGMVTHRQRPPTARGVVFMNLEDETGVVNVIFSPGAWVRWQHVALSTDALIVQGRIEQAEGVTNLIAEKVAPLYPVSHPDPLNTAMLPRPSVLPVLPGSRNWS
ncbi:MAG: DNA polymerase III subunit alpha [Acidimicrobiales bacterium]